MPLGLTQLLKLIEEMPAYRRLLDGLREKDISHRVTVIDAAKPYFMASLYHHLQIPMLVVTSQPEKGMKLYEQLSVWCASGQVLLFPEIDTLHHERVITDSSAEMERLHALSALVGTAREGGEEPVPPPLVIASAPAFMQKVAPHRDFAAVGHTIKLGMEAEPFHLLSQWQAMGYRLEDMVEVSGTISHRGGIVDIYPPIANLPARLEFFGNTIDSIRLFDPVSQRSLETVASINIGPATELLTPLLNSKPELESVLSGIDPTGCRSEVREQLNRELAMLLNKQKPDNILFYAPLFNQDSILSYLSREALLILDEPRSIRLTTEELVAKADELRAEKLERGELPLGLPRPYFAWEELEPIIEARRCLTLTAWEIPDGEQSYEMSFNN